MAAADSSDHDSSSSSVAGGAAASRRSSIGSDSVASSAAARSYKPHKSNQPEWKAIARLRSSSTPLGLEHFHLLRRVGSGDLGSVYLCRLRRIPSGAGDLHFAMKVVDRDAMAAKKKLQRAEAEREILRSLDHPFLPTLYADFEASHYSCLVMEFCPGGDLHAARQRLPGRRFDVAAARFYAAETVVALEYLHMLGIVYRDLKPENVLVRDDGHIMLSDFDLSFRCGVDDVVPRLLRRRARRPPPAAASPCIAPIKPVLSCFFGGRGRRGGEDSDDDDKDGGEGLELDPDEVVAEPTSTRSKSFVGTHEYLAPEVVSGDGHGGAVDWWALGVFIYEMIYGRTPFKGENNEKTLFNILKQQVSFPPLPPVAGGGGGGGKGQRRMEELLDAQDLMSRLLAKNPKRRIGSSKGSVEIKRHAFFKGVNWALIRSVKPPVVPSDVRSSRSSSIAAAATPATAAGGVQEKKSYKLAASKEVYSVPRYLDFF